MLVSTPIVMRQGGFPRASCRELLKKSREILPGLASRKRGGEHQGKKWTDGAVGSRKSLPLARLSIPLEREEQQTEEVSREDRAPTVLRFFLFGMISRDRTSAADQKRKKRQARRCVVEETADEGTG